MLHPTASLPHLDGALCIDACQNGLCAFDRSEHVRLCAAHASQHSCSSFTMKEEPQVKEYSAEYPMCAHG